MKWQGEEPKSVCSEPCPAGSIRNFQDQCCWVCVTCNLDAYAENDRCVSCGPGWRPNINVTGCDKIPAEVIDWLSPWALVPLVFSSLGICFTIFTTCVFIRLVTFIMASRVNRKSIKKRGEPGTTMVKRERERERFVIFSPRVL